MFAISCLMSFMSYVAVSRPCRLSKFTLTGPQKLFGKPTFTDKKPNMTPQNVIIAAKCNTIAKCNKNRRKM